MIINKLIHIPCGYFVFEFENQELETCPHCNTLIAFNETLVDQYQVTIDHTSGVMTPVKLERKVKS